MDYFQLRASFISDIEHLRSMLFFLSPQMLDMSKSRNIYGRERAKGCLLEVMW